jgi:hypothetical protein
METRQRILFVCVYRVRLPHSRCGTSRTRGSALDSFAVPCHRAVVGSYNTGHTAQNAPHITRGGRRTSSAGMPASVNRIALIRETVIEPVDQNVRINESDHTRRGPLFSSLEAASIQEIDACGGVWSLGRTNGALTLGR